MFTANMERPKSRKKSQNSRNQGFSYYFSLMIEGSGSRAGSGSYLGRMDPDPDPGGLKTCGSATLVRSIRIAIGLRLFGLKAKRHLWDKPVKTTF
jgi:hypothetical protein